MEEYRATCRCSSAHLLLLKSWIRRSECIGHNFLSFLHDCGQMTLILKALCIDLVDVLGAGRPGREPAIIRHDLQPADRGAVTWSGGQFARDRVAGESLNRDRCGRQLLKPRLLIRGRWRIDPRVVWSAELTC